MLKRRLTVSILLSVASRFRIRNWAWAILLPLTALTADCSVGTHAVAAVGVPIAATKVTITASDGTHAPLATRVLTDRVTVTHLADAVNHLQPAPLTPVVETECGMGPPLWVNVVFSGHQMTPVNFVVTPLSSSACNTTRLTIGTKKGRIVEAGDLTAETVSLLPVPLLTMAKESATLNGWAPQDISHYSLAGRAGLKGGGYEPCGC
jgi:hypothetical protein